MSDEVFGASAPAETSPRAVIFDLDGVVTDTAYRHSGAWRRLALELGWRFDDDLHDALRGVGRLESLAIVAARNGARLAPGEAARLADLKNRYYVESLASLSPADILPGIVGLLGDLRAAGMRIALASASRNAENILAKLRIAEKFDAVANPAGLPSKPHPGLFLEAARLLAVDPRRVAGIEDAQVGIEAIKAAGMKAVGVGAGLEGADITVPDTAALTFDVIGALFARNA